MTEKHIEPHRITKPIQLLAAWLVGLILTNACFLYTSREFGANTWEGAALVVAAIANVPLFLSALFVLQTRFRAELQEDTYYFEYLSKKSAEVVRIERGAVYDAKIQELEQRVRQLVVIANSGISAGESRNAQVAKLEWSAWRVALNRAHPRFQELREALRTGGIPVVEFFGSPEHVPHQWIVSVSYHLPTAHKLAVLRTVLPFGFLGVMFWEPEREADEMEDVYIGSYGGGECVTVTQEFIKLVGSDIENVDLMDYFKQHSSKLLIN